MIVEASDSVRHVFVTGLCNAHALERQAVQLMGRHIEHPVVRKSLSLRASGGQASH